MKIVNKPLGETADASAERHSALPELRYLLLMVTGIAIAVYIVVGVAVDLIVSQISYETERVIFGTFAMIEGDSSDKRLDRVRPILEKLTQQEGVPPLEYSLTVIPKQQPNAFAFPGGRIGVTTGLLEKLDDDVELAFVLGHELGHFKNRDHLRGMGRAVGVGVAFTILFGGEMGSDALTGTVRFVLDRGYSRDQEERADEYSVTLVHAAYGKAEGSDELFRILRDSDEVPEWAYMFSTHPSPSRRIENLKKYADGIAAQ